MAQQAHERPGFPAGSLRHELTGRALYAGFDQLVRRGLRGVWLRGELPPAPWVWAANHHSWWDGFLAAVVLAAERRPAAMLMDADNLAGFGFLRPLGVLPADQPRLGLSALRAGRVLVVFPEGELRTAGELARLAPGAGWLARQAPAPLVPVAVRVASRAHQYAEAYLDLGSPVEPVEPVEPAEPAGLADALGRQLATLDAELARTSPQEAPAGFRLLIEGRPSWDERIGRWQRASRWRPGLRRLERPARPARDR